jgi:hypothetical protein
MNAVVASSASRPIPPTYPASSRKSSVSHRSSVSRKPSIASFNPNPNELITYIVPDFNAISYIQKDFVTSGEFFLAEEAVVSGFDLYLVEQWVNSRKIGTVVWTFTGNQASKTSVIKFTILKKQLKYYPFRFQEYLNELMVNYAKIKKMDEEHSTTSSRRNSADPHHQRNGDIYTGRTDDDLLSKDSSNLSKKLTNLSTLTPEMDQESENTLSRPISRLANESKTNELCFVTNLASLPSNLNLIPVPHDSVDLEENFMINSNLKRLQCSGRSLFMTTSKISDANEDKFRHMYKINNVNIPIKFAIRELVNIIQISLFYFDLLDARYCDGLLCDKTEEAIINWWNLIGLPHFNIKPNPKNGILPARTVAAILSLILSIKLRLLMIGGCDVPKDPFEFESFMISIGQFQKQYKIEKRRKLDLETLNKLFAATNSILLPERNKISNFYDSPSRDNENPRTTGQLYKKNKGYYSNELRKLTNVVKNTVQDRINVSSRDLDDTSSGSRIRNKIAKLSENLNPLDVETLDMEYLKSHITGKVLMRLFYENSSPNVPKSGDGSKYNTHHHHHRRNIPENSAKQYKFVSLKDSITNSQNLGESTDISRYSRGLTRMKMGLQSRKVTSANTMKQRESVNESPCSPNNNFQSTIVDSLLQCDANSLHSEHTNKGTACDDKKFDPLEKFQFNLNRRNSFPFFMNEGNLNVLEFTKNDNKIKNVSWKRSLSFSSIEDHVFRGDGGSFVTIERFSYNYLKGVNTVLKHANLQKMYDSNHEGKEDGGKYRVNGTKFEQSNGQSNGTSRNGKQESNGNSLITLPVTNIKHSYKLLNLELIRLNNVHNQMISNKVRIVDEDLSDNLQYNFHELNSSIDRLIYETRILVKRIKELEESCHLLDIKLNDQCKTKLSDIVSNLVQLRKFNQVFADPDERKKLMTKLTRNIHIPEQKEKQEPSRNIFKIVVIFFYEMILYVFELFKFDRANMNMDRIRQSWVKLDPNRNIINQAYSFVGRDPGKGSVASKAEIDTEAKISWDKKTLDE